MSTMNQFHFKASSCVFETPSGKNYVFPTRFDKFEEDDVDCSVVEQYVPMRGKYISQGGPKIVVDRVWRCKSCLKKSRRCKNLTMKQRYIKGEWQTVSDYMADRNFPVDFMTRYLFYYRFSHVIIMRDFLASSQLPKGLAQKIGYYCNVQSALELKQIVEAVDGLEWDKLTSQLKNNENQPSLDDFQVELLKQCVKNLPIEKLRTWFESAEEGDNIYMRQCKHCLENNKSKPDNKTRKKAPPVAVYKASLRRAMVAKKDEIVCQHMNCGSIIKITVPEQLRATGIWCKNCYIVRALGQMKFNMEKYEEKEIRERECKNNILVSHIRSILFHFTNNNFHN